MLKNKNGITLIALSITVIVLLIIAGVSIGSVKSEKGLIKESKENTGIAQKESLIEKIESDLYIEKVKTGIEPTKEKLKEIIQKNDYSSSIGEDSFISKEGEQEIQYSEIQGWN